MIICRGEALLGDARLINVKIEVFQQRLITPREHLLAYLRLHIAKKFHYFDDLVFRFFNASKRDLF